MKICVKCKVEKPYSEFHNDKRRKDGLYPYCKDCRCKKGSKKRVLKDFYVHSKGYILVKKPEHPMSQKGGFVYEHRMNFYDEHKGRSLKCEMCGAFWNWRLYFDHIDHIDENKSNNDISNLRALCNPCNVTRTQKIHHKNTGRIPITFKGETKTPEEWSRHESVAVKGYTIRNRIKSGWSVYDALFKKSRKA